MTVAVDTHEKGGVMAEVRDHVEDFEVRDGFGADYVAGPLVIERKRWEELPGRMMDNENDLYMQLAKTANAAGTLAGEDGRDYTPALLLEGYQAELEHTAVPMENVLMYLHGVYVMGVQVLFSTGRECTARLLQKLDEGGDPTTGSVRDPEKVPRDKVPQYLVEGFEGIGPSRAQDILEHFGTARAVFAADEEELREVDGVGPATASEIVDSATQEWSS